MKLTSPQKEQYSQEQLTAPEAQRYAQLIAFSPVVFQVARLMKKFGIFTALREADEGLSLIEVAEKAKLSRYAAQVLLESSLTSGMVLLKEERFFLSKTGWFLLTDEMASVNMNFNHDVNYKGLFYLEEALTKGKPEGLSVFGSWPTVYEGLSQLPEDVRKSWFDFDHFYSDNSFRDALEIVFDNPVSSLLDVGGNTGKWALECVSYSNEVEVTIMDLPQQLEMMRENIKGKTGENRIHGLAANLLDSKTAFPANPEVIWMSQFLDCFSENEVFSILSRLKDSMSPESSLFIMETFWDRQRYETASFCLAQTSIYFTAMANGNSKMFHSDDLIRLINEAGLQVETIHDQLGLGHSLVKCKI